MFDFAGLVNAILRRDKNKGVTDFKSATILVEELPESEIQEAQVQINKALINLNKNSRLPIKERIKTVLYLDEKASIIQEKLCAEYLGSLENPKLRGRTYLNTILEFWDEMGAAYKNCIRAYGKTPSKSLQPLVQQVTARAIFVYASQAKWHHLRYLQIDGKLWRNLHRLYYFAEAEKFAQTPIQLYPRDTQARSCASLYTQAMLLSLARPDNLSNEQIHLVDTWLGQMAHHCQLETQIQPHLHTFAVNLTEPAPPRKLRRNMVDKSYRYWSTTALIEALRATIETLETTHDTTQVHLPNTLGVEKTIVTLQTISGRLSYDAEPIARRHERSRANEAITVARGMSEVINLLTRPKPTEHEEPFHIELSSASPSGINRVPHSANGQNQGNEWIMQNYSASGIGASYAAGVHDNLAIGALIGFRQSGKTHLALGVVRRLQRADSGDVSVGIETISENPMVVNLFTPDNPNKAISCIYISQSSLTDNRSLLVPNDAFVSGQFYLLKTPTKEFTIKLHLPSEMSTDFTRANFDVVSKN